MDAGPVAFREKYGLDVQEEITRMRNMWELYTWLHFAFSSKFSRELHFVLDYTSVVSYY